MTTSRAALASCALLLSLGACTPYKQMTEAPVAIAGEDLLLTGASVDVVLDGSKSYDPDGELVHYEWRYTGWPEGYVPPASDEDGGAPPPTDPTVDPLAMPPAFCSDSELLPDQVVQLRYCLVASVAKTTVTLTPGGYRFTLFVEDDEGKVAGDSIEVLVAPP